MDEVKPGRLSLHHAAGLKRPSDLLGLRFWDLFSQFGQREVPLDQPDNWSSVAVATIISGNDENPSGADIRLDAQLPSKAFASRPIVFFLNMSAPGLPMGAPVLRQSSGSTTLDAEVLKWLTRPDTLARLPAGFLELRVFP